MQRRDFLIAFVLAQAAPFALAQAKARRIAFLGTGSRTSIARPLEVFESELAALGRPDGRKIDVEYRFAESRFERTDGLAKELLAHEPEVLVVWGTVAATAAKRATSSVPVVMVNTGDPDATGLVASLARPGGNITGVANLGALTTAKQVELLAQIVPDLTRVAVIRKLGNASLAPQLKGAEAAALRLGVHLQVVDVRNESDFPAAFAAMTAGKAQAVLALADPIIFDRAKTIADLAIKAKLPTMSARPEAAQAGLMATYGANTTEQFRLGAVYVDRILRGAKPADLPVQQATTFEFVINLKTAHAIGLRIPETIAARADRLIQ